MPRKGRGKEKRVLSSGQRRKSPRLSRLSHAKNHDSCTLRERETSSCNSNNSCATEQSLLLAHPLHSCEQSDGALKHQDGRFNDDGSWLPEKSILELILDTLQRRDTYDIFAEPVDPSEVEEYYEIIKEPMDFGTMRAKLHEGMYKNLQQFEYDVFLIFGNALHFNSSTTVYFRQARVLEDLAKRIFFVLKSDPENFILKYSATKQKSGKRLDCELSGLPIDSCRKPARESGPNVIHMDHGQKGGRRQSKTSDVKDHRSTYQTWMCLNDAARSTITHAYDGTKSLINVNQGNVGYEESLLSFVKELGVTAHKVAKNKLLGLKMTASPSPHMSCWNLSTHHNNVQTTSVDSSSCGKETVTSVEGNFSMSRSLDTKTTKVAAFASLGTCIGKDDGNMRSWVASNSTMPPPELHADNLDLNHMPAIPSLTPLLNGFKDASMTAKVTHTSGLLEALKFNHVDHGGSVNKTRNDKFMITATANNNTVPLSSISSQPMLELPFPMPRVRDEGTHYRSGINSKPTTLDISCPVSTKICGSSSDGYATHLNGLYHHHRSHTCWKDQ